MSRIGKSIETNLLISGCLGLTELGKNGKLLVMIMDFLLGKMNIFLFICFETVLLCHPGWSAVA